MTEKKLNNMDNVGPIGLSNKYFIGLKRPSRDKRYELFWPLFH